MKQFAIRFAVGFTAGVALGALAFVVVRLIGFVLYLGELTGGY